MSTFYEIVDPLIRKAADSSEKSVTKFMMLIGLDPAQWSDYRKKGRLPSDSMLDAISEADSINLDINDLRALKALAEYPAFKEYLLESSPRLQRLFGKSDLPRELANHPGVTPIKSVVRVPIWAATPAAGAGTCVDSCDPYVIGYDELPAFMVPNPADSFLLVVEGDSMAPRIQSGDRVLVDKSITPQPGDTVLVQLDGSLFCKKLAKQGEQWLLLSTNPDYPPIEIQDQPEILYKIISMVAEF